MLGKGLSQINAPGLRPKTRYQLQRRNYKKLKHKKNKK